MRPRQKAHYHRILFLDNIRYLMVLLVVIGHAAGSYNSYTDWWPVNDDNSIFFDYLTRTLGIFFMPVLFFIAGYFALPSLIKKSTWSFIKNKFKRLGLPWLIGVILLGPIQVYIYYYSRHQQNLDLWSYFAVNMKRFLLLNTGLITSINEFTHLYFWFISLLLFFFIVFAILHKVKTGLFVDPVFSEVSKLPSKKLILLILFSVSVISTILTLIMHGIFAHGSKGEPWIIIFSLIQFQPTAIVLYIFSFGLGIYTFHKKWIINNRIPGHFVFWAILSVVLWFGQEKALAILLENILSPALAALFILLQTLMFFSVLLTLITFGGKYWNSASKVNKSLTENSYNIYLLHMIFVYLAQLLLLNWLDLSIYIKFIIVTLSAIFLSYLFSQYAIKPYPRMSVAGMISIFVLLLVFV